MTHIKGVLLETLQGLIDTDFKLLQWNLINSPEGFKSIPKSQLENADRLDTVDMMVQLYGHRGAVTITLTILKKMNHNQMVEELSNKHEKSGVKCEETYIGHEDSPTAEVKQQHIYLMSRLTQRYERILIGNSQTGHKKFLEDIYADLLIVENETGGFINGHEVLKLELSSRRPTCRESNVKCNDIFKVQTGTNRRHRKVLTMGIAGVGKTVSVSKFILDWAKGKDNQDINFIFPLPFRELNLKKDKKLSLTELLNECFFNTKCQLKSLPEEDGQILFIFDGLDECHFPLCFEDSKEVKDISEPTSVGSLITNLITGNLLPFALVWITCRPAATHLIPRDYIDFVTEVQGFSDAQKEAYFCKYCNKDTVLKRKMVSHIKKSRSLHIMCQIPVFCWISAIVLEPLMAQDNEKETPTTLTGMYINFLLQQKKIIKEKYHKETTKTVNIEQIILKLGKLAFHNLESGYLMFYEDDLRKFDIDVIDGTVFSGVCTQIFSQQEGVSEKNVFSFVHLSVQENLAALYVHHLFCNHNKNAFKKESPWNVLKRMSKITHLHKSAVDMALQSENGHMDLFLRFLLGLSLESNQRVLKELLPKLQAKVQNLSATTDYIKQKINEHMSFDRNMNLFHCLSELKDNSLTSEVQNYMNLGCLYSQELSSTQWSALVFVLLMSEETQNKFELMKYKTSEKGLRRLLPVVKITRRALLAGCSLNNESCKYLASVLQSVNSPLRELDLSNNDLQDAGVKLLSDGLKSSHCKLEILRLSGCMITEEGCSSLASALSLNPSNLIELDVTYNHPGDIGVKLLSAKLEDPHCRLEILRMENAGKSMIKPGLEKYACELTLDPNTAHPNLCLSEGNGKVMHVFEKLSYPGHPERFDHYPQVMCRESLSGRCYWEAEWSGEVCIAVTYIGINRKGDSDDCKLGSNGKSWGLICSSNRLFACHNNKFVDIPLFITSSSRVGVYLDWPAGTLSFYSISRDSHTPTHLHTFYLTLTEHLYAGFRVGLDSSVCVCHME